MTTALLLCIVFPVCFSCNAHGMHKNRAKIIEGYVLSAKFNEKADFPQLRHDKNKAANVNPMESEKSQAEGKDASIYLPSHGYHVEEGEDSPANNFNMLKERDLLVHHHHLPPPHPPPPPPLPPPPPAPIALAAPSIFAVGFITFLILLNALQTSLLITLRMKNSLLGSLTKPLGRRKRSAFDRKPILRPKTLTGFG